MNRNDFNEKYKLTPGSSTLSIFFTFAVSLFTCFLLLSGCNQSFQPIQDNSRAPFSMFGYLDASADTQTVRITPLQQQVGTIAEKPVMNVTLEHLGSGESVIMRDSLQYFYLPSGYTALNSNTTMELEFGQSYRLTAERPDGASSSVTVTIPEDFPSPEILPIDGEGCIIRLEISGVERLADIQYQIKVKISRPNLTFQRSLSAPYRASAREISSGKYALTINIPSARRRAFRELGSLPANTKLEILKRHIFVASGGPDWIDHEELQSINDLEYALPEVFSNIENGVGYVIGIVGKTISDDTCPG